MDHAPAPPKRLLDTLTALDAAGVAVSHDELVWLTTLANKADSPPEAGVSWVAGSAFVYGGQTFWPLHRLAMHWFTRWQTLLDGDDEAEVYLYAFAHTRSALGDESLLLLSVADAVQCAVKEWSDALAIHSQQMAELCERLKSIDGLPHAIPSPDAKPKPDEPPVNMHSDIAHLCKVFPGTTPRYWRSGISYAESKRILDGLDEAHDNRPAIRNNAIHNYRTAVKWVMHWRGKADKPTKPEDA